MIIRPCGGAFRASITTARGVKVSFLGATRELSAERARQWLLSSQELPEHEATASELAQQLIARVDAGETINTRVIQVLINRLMDAKRH